MHILAPLAVIPECQGMGGLLTRTGLEHLRLMGSQKVLYSATLLFLLSTLETEKRIASAEQ